MDWVKPKHRARRLKSSETTEADDEANQRTATQWLEQLCEENVALLQSALPVTGAAAKPKSRDRAIERYLNAMLWGTGDWDVANPNSRKYLFELVQAFGDASTKQANPQPSENKKRTAGPTPTESRSQQVAHAIKIGKWIAQQLPKASHDPYVALTSAGWLHALPVVGRDIPPALWLEVLQSTLTQVDRAWDNGNQDGLFPWVLWSCEVPLALAKQLAHLGGKDRIVSETLNRIALVLEQTADDPSGLLAFGAQDLRAVVASLIRSRWSATGVGARKWYPPQRKALSKLVTLMLHLTDGHGLPMLAEAATSRHDAELWNSALELAASTKKLTLASAASLPDAVGKGLGLKPTKVRKDKCNDASMPKTSMYWEASSIATMRRSWRDVGCRVAVDFSSDVIWLDITGEDGHRVFSGDWDIELRRNGKPVVVDVAWEEVCWFSDDDVDYLELECDLEGTCKIQRQIMLMREEGMVMMADAVLGTSEARWEAQSHWQLDPSVAWVPEAKTNEGFLMRTVEADGESTSIPAALIMPIGLPEWRRGTKTGNLAGSGQQLTLEVSTEQRCTYGPLLVALRSLSKKPVYTWRPLTIAQDLANVSADIARGYRVQIGRDQWLIYRSLAACKRRTLMGLHLNTEYYAARFLTDDGTFEPLIEVSAE